MNNAIAIATEIIVLNKARTDYHCFLRPDGTLVLQDAVLQAFELLPPRLVASLNRLPTALLSGGCLKTTRQTQWSPFPVDDAALASQRDTSLGLAGVKAFRAKKEGTAKGKREAAAKRAKTKVVLNGLTLDDVDLLITKLIEAKAAATT